MEIKQKLIPKSNTKTRPGTRMTASYITLHETANTSRGADAEAHANLQYKGNSRTASWHFTVDDKEIWQSIPTNEVAYHAGTSAGNRQSIGIEICVNSDGDYTKAKANAIWLVQYLMKKHNIPVGRVVPHKHWSGKDCPHKLLPQWSSFINQIKSGSVATVATADNMYDLSIAKEYKLVGLRSSKHPEEIGETVAKMMEANANFLVLAKRGADLRVLQKTLNEMYPPE